MWAIHCTHHELVLMSFHGMIILFTLAQRTAIEPSSDDCNGNDSNENMFMISVEVSSFFHLETI